ncbi:hypothetical protein D1614_23590 [Maribellus luteus]|uniref:Uncharacterized protein n=1 Tax=Maribellus luteus TaxID=2305463 RepID=A0A399SQT6_9BACT|nr:hypothetical protein D1614_23590 [Maribellus luteus]
MIPYPCLSRREILLIDAEKVFKKVTADREIAKVIPHKETHLTPISECQIRTAFHYIPILNVFYCSQTYEGTTVLTRQLSADRTV